MRICTVTNSENDAANARLIAAAPELLEACKMALCVIVENECPNTPERLQIFKQILAALGKAEGRTHGPR